MFCDYVAYFVMQFYVDAQYTDLKLAVDILIGTVPLRETVRSLPAAHFQQVITTQPASAPPPDQADIDNFNLRMFHFSFYTVESCST